VAGTPRNIFSNKKLIIGGLVYNDGLTRVFYRTDFEIGGEKITILECGKPPTDEYGQQDIDLLYKQTFLADSSEKNVFYEAYVSGQNRPFFVSKEPPTDEELHFQLEKFQRNKIIKIVVGISVAVFFLYFFLKN